MTTYFTAETGVKTIEFFISIISRSDEKSCQMVSLEEGYNKIVPPYTTNEELLVYGKPTIYPVQVNISISPLNIVEIDELDFSITFHFEINLEWFEYRWPLDRFPSI